MSAVSTMQVTTLIERMRREYLLEGDYKVYRKHTARQLHTIRKQLGVSTPKGIKNPPTKNVSAEDIGKNTGFARIMILSAERAWAHAWTMKTGRPETQSISGPTRRHIISRFRKAVSFANALCSVLQEQNVSNAQDVDILEARGYAACLAGTLELNKHAGRRIEDSSEKKRVWQRCLRSFATAYVIYASLFRSTGTQIFRDFVENDVEPSLRYAAYQYGLSRTMATSQIAIVNFPQDKAELSKKIETLDANAFKEQKVVTVDADRRTSELPTSITWRSHQSPIVDAAIGQAIAETRLAEERLEKIFKAALDDPNTSSQGLAASYDTVLTACQDTVDITRRVITELLKEGIPESDPRMQHLRVADLSVNYSLVDWRAGRNRVLASGKRLDDGRTFDLGRTHNNTRPRESVEKSGVREETQKHMQRRLQQRIVLYDSIIQSIDAVHTIRGANRDENFVEEMSGKRAYFAALKCLNLGFSHDLLGHHDKALALYHRGEQLSTSSREYLQNATESEAQNESRPMTLNISAQRQDLLCKTLATLVARRRGAVALRSTAGSGDIHINLGDPLIGRLQQYQGSEKVDLFNLVTYPPSLEPVPVKPIYLDLAWNFINYPGKDGLGEGNKMDGEARQEGEVEKQSKNSKRRGWFEFGRG